ncbi:hypothetical protein GCM10023149_36280 [Mucilaginibacter gynuensis]|uniref:Uncharacterized protein n=1 Tax=Mucilaginibacter gynuensis TaxID=1302236 RepID=A0ABP8GW43_9SPHI
MDQYQNNRQNELLYELLADPANTGQFHAQNLQQLVSQYPQSGFLHALLVHAGGGQNPAQAAAYFDTRALQKLIQDAPGLPAVQLEQVFHQNGSIGLREYNDNASLAAEIEARPVQYFDDAQVIELSTETYPEAIITPVDEITPLIEAQAEEAPIQNEPQAEETPLQFIDEEANPTAVEDSLQPVQGAVDIEDEVYDEIVGIEHIAIDAVNNNAIVADSESAVLTYADPFSAEDSHNLTHPQEEATPDVTAKAENTFNIKDEAEKLYVGNIAATDYFMFDRAFSERTPTNETPEPEAQPITGQPAEQKTVADDEEVMKYHDDTMPYTFMWWLSKTRKEHAGVNQPYAHFKPQAVQATKTGAAVPDALQHQYVENIFHITSVEQLDKSTAQHVETNVKRKGDEIVERFIKEEPQIKPPSSERLDNENKARKSSEDHGELVSETLATIYADQMLYHKAISIYKKLMLKFPEKSRYFADQIKNLEKRTN